MVSWPPETFEKMFLLFSNISDQFLKHMLNLFAFYIGFFIHYCFQYKVAKIKENAFLILILKITFKNTSTPDPWPTPK